MSMMQREGMSEVEAKWRKELIERVQRAEELRRHARSFDDRRVGEPAERAAAEVRHRQAHGESMYAAGGVTVLEHILDDLSTPAFDETLIPYKENWLYYDARAGYAYRAGLGDTGYTAYLIAGGLLGYAAWRWYGDEYRRLFARLSGTDEVDATEMQRRQTLADWLLIDENE